MQTEIVFITGIVLQSFTFGRLLSLRPCHDSDDCPSKKYSTKILFFLPSNCPEPPQQAAAESVCVHASNTPFHTPILCTQPLSIAFTP